MYDITIFNRYTKEFEYETVFGEKFLKFIYGSTVGKLAVSAFIKRKFFSLLCSLYTNSKLSVPKIKPFIEKYGIHAKSFEKKIENFTSFNDFFTRKLKPSARPISKQEGAVIAPADGRILAYESMANTSPFFVKGERLNVDYLIKNKTIAKKFSKNCSMLIARLCPMDYHRFHFPIDCTPQRTYLINGSYLSIHPLAMRGYFSTFLQNKRMSTILQTKDCGNILMIEIGATCIGSIKQTFTPFKESIKGEEKGYFEFGGSTVILLFEKNRIKFSEDILENTKEGIETYVLMGDSVAQVA